MEGYKNILADKYIRDTNYLIIKDTDDLEDLENQWNRFTSLMTPRQQRLSDDKSITIWNMTNQQHYEYLKEKLMDKISDNMDDLGDEPDNIDFVGDIEESAIPVNDTSELGDLVDDPSDDARRYEISSNLHIVGIPKGETSSEKLKDLERQYQEFESLNTDHKRKADDECRRLFGFSNLERYGRLRSELLASQAEEEEKTEIIKPTEDNHSEHIQKITSEGFVGECYRERIIRESKEQKKVKEKRKLNDLPYFTPQEMIDMGVHGRDNYYCDKADNDGLTTKIKVPLWFTSYRDMCMDHIFEDYRKEWINKLVELYSDFEEIKESGDESRILARKQSILDLGWNPEIPFTPENRRRASDRVNMLIEQTIPRDIFINLDDVIDPGEDYVNEVVDKETHEPCFLIFTKGKTPIISSGISAVTKSEYTHASISFVPELDETWSFTISKMGLMKESLESFGNCFITVYAFFVDKVTMNKFKERLQEYKDAKGKYDFGILVQKLFGKDKKINTNQYNQVCSTFVDDVLKSGGVNIVGDKTLPVPGDLYTASKQQPNKIIEVFSGIAVKYNSAKVKRKLSVLYKNGTLAINETFRYYNEVARINDKGEKVPETCDKCGSKIGLYLQGEPVFLCSNKECKKFFGTLPCRPPRSKKRTVSESSSVYYHNDNIHKEDETMLESISSMNSFEKGDLYYNIEQWESGESNSMWITGLSGSGKSTLAKEIANEYKAEYVELDNIQRAKMDNWDTTGSYLLDLYIKLKGGLKNIFTYVNDLDKVSWKDIVSNEKCGDQFNDLFEFILSYIDTHRDKKFVIEGVQIAYSANRENTINISKHPVIIKNPNAVKAEIRREMRLIKYGIKNRDNFFNIMSKATRNHIRWIKNKFYVDDVNYVKDFQSFMKESFVLEAQLPKGVTLRNATKDDTDNMIKWELESVDSNLRKDPKVVKLIKDDVKVSIPNTKMIMYNDETIGMFTTDRLSPGSEYWYIGEIYIVKEHRGKGIGTTLIKNEIAKHNKIKLQVAQSNKSAQKLYKSFGFKITETDDKNKMYVMTLDKSDLNEHVSILNEVKRFPVEFDDNGNLTIYKCRMGNIAYGDEIAESVQLLESYRNTSNIEGMKYEVSRVWFLIQSIEKRMKKKKITEEEKAELTRHKTTAFNVFKFNLEYLMKTDDEFNFIEYYNNTPFSDNGVKITSGTLKFSLLALKNLMMG